MKKVILALFVFQSLFLSAQINPINLGNATNPFSSAEEGQNQVIADDSTGLVVFIHRQDINIHGGTSIDDNSRLRYDISLDGGLTFTSNLGTVNPNFFKRTRYPQIINYNPPGNTNPENCELLWVAPTINNANTAYQGIAYGALDADTNASVHQEVYNFPNNESILGGLCERVKGEYWTTSISPSSGELSIYKGLKDSAGVTWSLDTSFIPPHKLITGNVRRIHPNMAFSPSGDTGWVAFLGDLIGGQDSVYSPILIPSFDGGATWGIPIEVDLRSLAYQSFTGNTIQGDLTNFWKTVDPNTGDTIPRASGIPALAFAFDMTVDKYGSPHLAVPLMNKYDLYAVTSREEMYLVDIYYDVFVNQFAAKRVSSLYTWRYWFPVNSPSLTIDNYLQISRTPDGSRIFYSWLDSDTSITGFDNPRNKEHNLRIASQRVTDGFFTCVKKVVNTNDAWDRDMFYSTMAPEVLTSANGEYHLPIVVASFDTALGGNAPTEFWYVGNDAVINESDYVSTALNLDANNCLLVNNIGMADLELKTDFTITPNPFRDQFVLDLDNYSGAIHGVQIINIVGQVVYEGFITQNSTTISTQNLAPGVYVLLLTDGTRQSTRRLVKN